MYSEHSRFHSNRFTFGGVIHERVNTVKTRRKMNPIFGWSLASSRIITRVKYVVHYCLSATRATIIMSRRSCLLYHVVDEISISTVRLTAVNELMAHFCKEATPSEAFLQPRSSHAWGSRDLWRPRALFVCRWQVYYEAISLTYRHALWVCALDCSVWHIPVDGAITQTSVVYDVSSFPFAADCIVATSLIPSSDAVVHLCLRSVGRGFKSCSRQRCVTTLGKLFTPMCLCHQAV